MTKSRIDSALDIRSVHEAGHAMAAVRNRVAFSYVSIERDPLPGTGGHIRLWRRGESEYSDVLKTCKLLIFRHARNALASGIAPNWNASGTPLFRWPIRIFNSLRAVLQLPRTGLMTQNNFRFGPLWVPEILARSVPPGKTSCRLR
jgi:hypothetical protein